MSRDAEATNDCQDLSRERAMDEENNERGTNGDWLKEMNFVRITEGAFIYKIDCIDFHDVNCTVCALSLSYQDFFPIL